jgi:hypothetical protein
MPILRTIARSRSRSAAVLFLASIAGTAAVLAAQGARTQTSTANARTAFGQPNLEGVWSFATLTPLERPADLAAKTVFTEKEAADYERRLLQQFDHDTPAGAERVCKGTGNYNEFWYDRGSSIVKTRRTSLIIDPSDGRIPPLTPEGIARREARAAARKGRGPADSWEDRGLAERCIIGFNAGPPMMPSAYNNNFQLFLSAHYAVILTEMVHDARIVPLDGRPPLSSSISQWAGSSRGHWEGDTLVVETRNFTDKTGYQGTGEKLRLVERFRRADADTLMYEFTVDDPATFTRPWTAQIPMTRVPGQLFEYACHEGNYGLAGILSGHRAEEQAEGKP